MTLFHLFCDKKKNSLFVVYLDLILEKGKIQTTSILQLK